MAIMAETLGMTLPGTAVLASSDPRPEVLAEAPPTALSGATCSTTVPNSVPLIRPSVIRSMSVTPWPSSLAGIGMLPHSGMAIPVGPQPASESAATSSAGSLIRPRISS
jgi:hypothetical protein